MKKESPYSAMDSGRVRRDGLRDVSHDGHSDAVFELAITSHHVTHTENWLYQKDATVVFWAKLCSEAEFNL